MISIGMLFGAAGMFFLSRITADSSYATHVLPILPVMGIGFGMIFSTSFNTATAGVARTDAGVASASLNTMQQVGGSIGTALLSTIAAHATTSYLVDHPGQANVMDGAVHGYTTAFLVAGGIFIFGAITIFLLIKPHVVPGAPSTAENPSAEPKIAEPATAE
jgi:MFS family permease